jgi:integrase
MGKLTLRALPSLAKRQGRHGDGQGLFLRVLAPGPQGGKPERRFWTYRFRLGGKETELSLGPYPKVGLDEARRLHAAARGKVANGIDPRADKRARRAMRANRAATEGVAFAKPTFGEVAADYAETHERGWRSHKHRQQWSNSLRDYCASLCSVPVDRIDTAAVLAVLKPVWAAKPSTASRVRGRIEKVLGAAKALGLIDRDRANPAAWRDNLDHLLPKQAKLVRGHHAAMSYDRLPGFMGKLRALPGPAARALEFCILTAARSGEVLGAAWDEADLASALWSIAGARMKSARPHRVPLSEPALEILRAMLALRKGDHPYVFPGQRPRRPLSNMGMDMVLRRLGASEATVHGFRSTFRDWAGDKTHAQREVIEAALAHAVGDETELAYRRGDALAKRRELMDHWAAFAGGGEAASGANMVAFQRR